MSREPKDEVQMDFGIRLKGTLAVAFEKERRNEGAAKAEMVRRLLVEALRARGYTEVEDPVEWGGYRRRKDEEEEQGQLMGAAVA